MRTALLADALAARGHTVIWWASLFDHMSKKMLGNDDTDFVTGEGHTIKALKGIPYSNNVSLRRYLDHRLIARKFRRIAPQLQRPDAIVAALPDHHLAYEAVRYAKGHGVPVIIDVRDKWPDWFLDVVPVPMLKPLARLLLTEDFRRVQWLLGQADSIVGSSARYLEWALERAGRERQEHDHVIYLGAKALPTAPVPAPSPEFRDLIRGLHGKNVITFVGTFGRYYNPAVVARAARMLATREAGEPPCLFVIAGDGVTHAEVAAEASGLSNVVMTGWLGSEQVFSLLAHSTIGVIPCSEVVDATPNKAFTYLSAGLPIVSSLSGEMAELIEREGIGLSFPPGDASELADRVLFLCRNPQLLAQMSQKAHRLFADRFDAGRIYAKYAQHVERIARKFEVPGSWSDPRIG